MIVDDVRVLMAETAEAQQQQKDVKVLFKQWRSGDPNAGITMAQRFSDWYYAITVMRLGDQRARAPLEQACQIFAQRIMEVTNAEDLIDFAHRIVLDQLQAAGGRAPGGDFPNGITSNRQPSVLLQDASGALTSKQLRILHSTYAGTGPAQGVDADMPFSALDARHALKQVLARTASVPFSVLPEAPDPDRAPLPLYEAARLASDEEERRFEQWLLTDIDLCKDLAEFSAFAHALRAGALSDLSGRPTASSSPPPSRPTTPLATKSPAIKPPDIPVTRPAAPSGASRGLLFVGIAAAAALVTGILYAVFG